MRFFAVLLLGVLLVGVAPTEAAPLSDAEVGCLVKITRQAARGVEGTAPERDLTFTYIEGNDSRAYPDGTIHIGREARPRRWESSQERFGTIVVHEVAHVLTPGDGHGDTWLKVFRAAIDLADLRNPLLDPVDGGVETDQHFQNCFQ